MVLILKLCCTNVYSNGNLLWLQREHETNNTWQTNDMCVNCDRTSNGTEILNEKGVAST
jgi:hypothetical protein